MPNVVKQALRALTPKCVRRYFHKINQRIGGLERRVEELDFVVDILIEHPRFDPESELAFNGQNGRKGIFFELMQSLPFRVIVETGTWIGSTTGFMAHRTGLPVYSAEIQARFHKIAKMHLSDMENVALYNHDSREFLRRVLQRDVIGAKAVFFYLDAHSYDDSPLLGEIELISGSVKEFAIMVDDFRVPGDEGYGYDHYASGLSLTLDHIGAFLEKQDLQVFFPSQPSADETGRKRGSVVIARRDSFGEKLRSLKGLRRYLG